MFCTGGKVNKKGRARHFTSPEEIERQNREDRKALRVSTTFRALRQLICLPLRYFNHCVLYYCDA